MKIKEMVKKLPPFANDEIQQSDIENFAKIGTIGWSYITTQILNEGALTDKISELRTRKENQMQMNQKKKSKGGYARQGTINISHPHHCESPQVKLQKRHTVAPTSSTSIPVDCSNPHEHSMQIKAHQEEKAKIKEMVNDWPCKQTSQGHQHRKEKTRHRLF